MSVVRLAVAISLASTVVVAWCGGMSLGAWDSGAIVSAPPGIVYPLNDGTATFEPWLSRRVADLNSDDLGTRERADVEISNDRRVTLEVIERLIAGGAGLDNNLSPEQRERLMHIGLRMFASTPRAAMGVSFGTDRDVEGVQIGGANEGFDSSRVLIRGDIIQAMDDAPVKNRSHARAMIVSYSPGDEVALKLLRQGEPVTVRVRLGEYRKLKPPQVLELRTVRLAWDLRREREFGTSAHKAVIDPALTDAQWAQLTQRARQTRSPQVRIVQDNGFRNIQTFEQQPVADDQSVAVGPGGAMRQRITDPPADFRRVLPGNTPAAARIQAVQQQINKCAADINQFQAMLRDPGMGAEKRLNYQRLLDDRKTELTKLISLQAQLRRQVEP